jgi:hypothetical protein
MRDIDRKFLILFKDLKITPNRLHPETPDGKPNYVCYIGKDCIRKSEVIRMVKEYQDEIVKMLLEETNSEG